MGQVVLWRAVDGRLERTFAGPPASTIDAWASSLAFSSDGRRLATSLGILIDLDSSSTVDLETAAPRRFTLAVNPANLSTGVAVPELRFVAGDRKLFADTELRVGNSPETTHLGLRDVATGREIVLFHGYARALHGHALSPDGRLLATARSDENLLPGYGAGLTLFRTDTGQPVASDPGFSGRVLAFSSDGTRVVTQTGATVEVLDASAPLSRVAAWTWSDRATFVAVAPDDQLVGSEPPGITTFRDLATGRTRRAIPGALRDLSSSRDGRYLIGSGTGLPGDALFHVWRAAGGSPLCAPRAPGAPAPDLLSLGAPLAPSGRVASADGSLVATDQAALHTHAADWTAIHVRGAGREATFDLRVFGATSPPRPFAMAGDGDRLFTQEGPAVAVWCRSSSEP